MLNGHPITDVWVMRRWRRNGDYNLMRMGPAIENLVGNLPWGLEDGARDRIRAELLNGDTLKTRWAEFHVVGAYG